MRINNNMTAMNTHRLLRANGGVLEKQMEKLSSGYRINRAGDDAAGLAISEKMRAQIKGLKQASRNAQDSISLIQTAEGGTKEIHEILHRMRVLSVQSSNDTNVPEDRINIQSEMSLLIEEVDRIANSTEFNSIKLLNGQVSSGSVSQSTIDTLTSALPAYIDDAMDQIEGNLSIDSPVGTRNLDITYYYDENTTTGASMGTSDAGANLSMRINLANITQPNGSLVEPEIVDTLIAHEVMHGYQFMNMSFATDGVNNNLENWFLEGLSMAVQGGNLFADDLVSPQNVSLTNPFDGDYRSAYEAVKVLHEISSNGINDIIDRLEAGVDLNTAIGAIQTAGAFSAGDIGTLDGVHTLAGITDVTSFIAYYNDSTDVDTFLGRTGAGQEFDSTKTGVITDGALQGSTSTLSLADTIFNDAADTTATSAFNISFTNPNFIGSGNGITMQIGANKGQDIKIDIGNVTALNLGIDNLDVTTLANSQNAISTLDSALKSVSMTRSRLGAYQNRLEYTINNLDNTAENLQSAESRVRDVDMAREMMDFTKNNILQQAGQSMLAQANQAPQGILQLLR